MHISVYHINRFPFNKNLYNQKSCSTIKQNIVLLIKHILFYLIKLIKTEYCFIKTAYTVFHKNSIHIHNQISEYCIINNIYTVFHRNSIHICT